LRSFEFEFFVVDVTIDVGFGFFGWCHWALGPNCKGQFFFSF